MRCLAACVVRVTVCLAMLGAAVPVYAQQTATVAEPPAPAAAPDAGSTPFHLLLGAYLTAAGADVSVSMYQIGRGTGREVGFGASFQDSPVALSVAKSAMSAAVAYQLTRMRRHRPKLAFTLLAITTGIEAALAVHAATISAPAR